MPINVPALALQTGEDHVDLDRELKLHGYSNFFSGMAGSIQNYLVFANTVLFMRSGGTSRLAGFMVAALTFVVMMIGPYIIGYIPIMMVGVLIFDLGFELLLEALWSPRKKLKFLEFITVVVIVLVMGMYDFVVGIGIGIVLAFGSLIVQTSRISAVRSGFSGDAVRSTVRRNPSQQRYLREVGQQIHILRLSGFLFFGTVVSVEQEIRDLTADEEFEKHPIRFLLIDLWQVTGLDYSAGEAFNTISRLLDNRGISLVLSGLDPDSSLGQSLRAVGFGKNVEVPMLPDLNSALESCENELLKTFYVGQEAAKRSASSSPRVLSATNVDVPGANGKHRGDDSDGVHPFDMLASSPRRTLLRLAASRSLSQTDVARLSRWQSFKEPLRLLLQIFHGLSDRNEDFWFQAMGYFSRRELPAGTVLFHRGDRAECFYLLEKGILRAEVSPPTRSRGVACTHSPPVRAIRGHMTDRQTVRPRAWPARGGHCGGHDVRRASLLLGHAADGQRGGGAGLRAVAPGPRGLGASAEGGARGGAGAAQDIAQADERTHERHHVVYADGRDVGAAG